MEVIAAHARGLRERVEAGFVFGAFDRLASGCDERALPFEQRGLIGLASLAWPEACALGIRARRVECDIPAQRLARRARRTAVHASGFDGIKELPIGGAIATHHRVPPLFVGGPAGRPDSCGGLDEGIHVHGVLLGRRMNDILASALQQALPVLLSNSDSSPVRNCTREMSPAGCAHDTLRHRIEHRMASSRGIAARERTWATKNWSGSN
jgi:hypothetical protein